MASDVQSIPASPTVPSIPAYTCYRVMVTPMAFIADGTKKISEKVEEILAGELGVNDITMPDTRPCRVYVAVTMCVDD